jgi:chromosome segregation and condensation protein ScpB
MPAAAKEVHGVRLAEFDSTGHIHPCPVVAKRHDEQLSRMAGLSPPAKTFTSKQGQYLAYIHLYRRPPGKADIRQYFGVTPPSVLQMVLTLERAGFIRRRPRVARSGEVLVDPKPLPELL